MKKTRLFAGFLAALLAVVSLGIASPVSAAPNQPANAKTYRVKINNFDSASKQLAGSQFNIVKGQSASGEVVDTFTSTDEAYYAELSEGTYTLVETQTPAGYKAADSQTFTVRKPDRWTDPTINNHYKATTESFYVNGYYWKTYNYTVTQNVTTGQAVAEVVYCVNSDKSSPAPNSDYIKRDGSADVLADAASKTIRHRDSEALRSKLMSIVYNGYPTNASNIQGSLTNDQFRTVTQLAVWDTVDQQKRSSAFTNQKMKDAYNKLMEYRQNVPEELEAHMYQVSAGQAARYQSLMGTAFGEKAAPMEINVKHEKITKTDVIFSKTGITKGEELPGASLEVRDEHGATLESWISEETPHVFALTPGTYSMHESQAPKGYDIAEDITFRVNKDFSVEIKNGDEWVLAENATVTMKDTLTPVTYGEELTEDKPNLPNTGTPKEESVLASTGAKLAIPLALMLIGAGAFLLRKKQAK